VEQRNWGDQGAHAKAFIVLYSLFIISLAAWRLSVGVPFGSYDGLYYMNWSRNILEGNGYNTPVISPIQCRNKAPQEPPFKFRGINNKPLFPHFEALVFKVLGPSGRSAFLAVYVFYAAAGAVFFFLALRAWGPAAAWTGTVLFQSSDIIMSFAPSAHADSSFIFWVASAGLITFLAPRDKAWIGGVFAGAACLTRPNGLLIAFSLAVAVGLRELFTQGPLKQRFMRLGLYCLPIAAANVYMLSFNYIYYGGPLWYYDYGGREFQSGDVGEYHVYYDSYAGEKTIAAQKTPLLLKLIPSYGFIKGLLESQWVFIQERLSLDPCRSGLFLAGALWALFISREPRILWLLGAGFGVFFLQFSVNRLIVNDLRTIIWMVPFLAAAAGIMISDLIGMIQKLRATSLKLAAGLALGAVFLAASMKFSGMFMSGAYAPKNLEVIHDQAEWLDEAGRLEGYFSPASVVVGKAPLEILIHWRTKVFALELPGDFRSLLGCLKKLNTDDFYQITTVSEDIFKPRDRECVWDSFAEAAPYTSLVHQNRYFCLYKLDIKSVRRDFAAQMASIPN